MDWEAPSPLRMGGKIIPLKILLQHTNLLFIHCAIGRHLTILAFLLPFTVAHRHSWVAGGLLKWLPDWMTFAPQAGSGVPGGRR